MCRFKIRLENYSDWLLMVTSSLVSVLIVWIFIDRFSYADVALTNACA